MMGKSMNMKEQGKLLMCIAIALQLTRGCDHSCFSEVQICLLHCELKLCDLNPYNFTF